MKLLHALVVLLVSIGVSTPVAASSEQYSEELHQKQREIDRDNLVGEPLRSALDASCNVNDALKAGLSGDSKNFAEALDAAEQKLQSVAQKLAPLADKGQFKKVVLKTPRPLSLPWGTPMMIRTGDDILRAIATLAQRSADAIARIKNGKGTDEDFAEITTNSAVISELIVEFYGIRTV